MLTFLFAYLLGVIIAMTLAFVAVEARLRANKRPRWAMYAIVAFLWPLWLLSAIILAGIGWVSIVRDRP